MLPLVNATNVNGVPLTKLLDETTINQIIERTRKGGAEIVELLGTGSAYYAPASAVYTMLEAILKDQQRLLPSIAYLENEYGFSDICLGVPTIIGENGIERILELELSGEELKQLKISANAVQQVKQSLKNK